MSGIPSEIPEIGSVGVKLRQNPGFDPMRAGISPEDYFVWSRFDGATSVRDLILMIGFPTERTVDIVRRLRTLGALLLPGESAPRPPTAPARAESAPPLSPGASGRRPTAPGRPATSSEMPTVERPDGGPDSLPDPRPDERLALAERVDLDDAERRRILAMMRIISTSDAWGVLGIERGADKKALKRTYFRLSKEFHPDRFYGKRLGTFAERLAAIFEAIAHAYEELTEGVSKQRKTSPSQTPQTPQEYAADLFARACALEVGGDPAGALKLFDAAIRVDAQLRYLRRAATCALSSRQVRVAEEYAKKAANLDPADPSNARLLAAAFRAAGKLGDAEEVLVMAMALKNENDALGTELRADLAEVRRLLGGRADRP